MSRLALESPWPPVVEVPEGQKLSPKGLSWQQDEVRSGGFVAPLMGLAEASSQAPGRAGMRHCQGVPPPRRAEAQLHRHFQDLPWDPVSGKSTLVNSRKNVEGFTWHTTGADPTRSQHKSLATHGWSRPLLQASCV